ncbi:unnamed protein product [Bursaphelenchus xylophilus]|uniref:(pine wood nematode) hypothetical protein n=1 Tax=Bursaphelenchus xylophilus TaxID=6326 RepID=A0A7I8WWQ9_BURXY|nr:unnamed protein product [Bursaphelenchus xylophilus]CAG9099672.1 unnamed protein product [Bursaphelenchus xylophilus]
MRILVVSVCLLALGSAQDPNAAQANPNGQAPAPNANQQNLGNTPQLAHRAECRSDLEKYCKKAVAQLPPGEILSDMAALECLQEAGYSETEKLTPECSQAVWEFKIVLTQDKRFITAIKHFCDAEMKANPGIAACANDERPGYALSCVMDFGHTMDQNTRCFQFLLRTERLAFSDFRLVAPFVDKCGKTVADLGCGTLTKPSAHQGARYPHSQGSVLECLIDKMVNIPKDAAKAQIIQNLPTECRKEVMRIAELQSEDWHMDRPLYFACREDRERFCSEVQAGEGRVFQCLMDHKDDKTMEPGCAKIIAERAGLMGQDYRLAHPLLKGCKNEMKAYQCTPQVGFERSQNFHLSWVLLCLENGQHQYNKQQHEKQQAEKENKQPQATPDLMPFTQECNHEMQQHRSMMVSEFRMSPELVMTCAQEIDKYCSPKGDLESGGKTIHCLMSHAEARDEKKVLGPQCVNALQQLMKVADVGSNYRVDKVLWQSCRPLIEGKCKMDAVSEAQTLSCLMANLDGPDMTDDCEDRLLEVQYFMARDWSLDPQLYDSCHKDAIQRCSAVDNWHQPKTDEARVDPGPQVLACLYRNSYDEQQPLSKECQVQVHRVLRERAQRVNLIPDIEESCRDALSEYCSQNVKPQEEMNCLQKQFEIPQFKEKHPKCHGEIYKFTQMESKDTKLNRLLTAACRPVIDVYCKQLMNEDIDHGDVMMCLSQHKGAREMNNKCRSYVQHFELISLRDYHFNYKFTQACKPDIDQYCAAFGNDEGAIIRCLSNIMFEHKVLGESKDLHKECKKQLRTAFLQQEQVDFDDKEHMGDVDPVMMQACDADLSRYQCKNKKNFEEVVQCLREHFDDLAVQCKRFVFQRQEVEAADNSFDTELQRTCSFDINKYCRSQSDDKVLDCLSNTKIIRLLQKGCQKLVKERMLERFEDDRLNPGLLAACKDEAETHCPEEYRRLNSPQRSQDALGPAIANCLRAKYSQFNSKVHLGPQCKDEVSKIILESEFDVTLDPQLYQACKGIINRHCSNTIITKGGNFDSVLECLKADLYTNQISDRNCAAQLIRRTQESLVDIHMDPSLHEACSVDIQRICREVPPGQGRIITCLIDALDVPQTPMSSGCRTKLVERKKLWNMAHDDYKMELPETWAEAYSVIANHPQRTSILTVTGVVLLVLLLIGCCCGRLTKRQYSELKNRSIPRVAPYSQNSLTTNMMSTHLMNGAQDVPDFYSAPGKTDMFKDSSHREVITYTEDGRALIAGKPLDKRDPEDMWSQLILQMMCQRLAINSNSRESKIKRFFGRNSKVEKKESTGRIYVTNISISN